LADHARCIPVLHAVLLLFTDVAMAAVRSIGLQVVEDSEDGGPAAVFPAALAAARVAADLAIPEATEICASSFDRRSLAHADLIVPLLVAAIVLGTLPIVTSPVQNT